MATINPISSISYNSLEFLKEKLDTWYNNHLISCYMLIQHKGEDGDKDHIHFRIEPNKRLDPMNLVEDLREYVPGNSKPLGCRPFRPSKEEDWILYAVHDSQYLKLKYSGGEKGEKLPYNWQDVIVSEYYDFEVAFIRAKSYLEHTSQNIATKLRDGTKPINLILEGENPHTVNAIMKALDITDYQRLNREHKLLSRDFQILLNAVNDLGYDFVDSKLVLRSHE